MKNKFKHPINYIAVLTALMSFSIGTLLLLVYKISGYSNLIAIGYFYTIVAAIVNSILVLLLLLNILLNFKNSKEHLLTLGIVLANIPIVIFYMDVVL